MISQWKTPIVLAAVALAGCGLGCGGSSEAGTITKAEFVKRATAICERERAGMIRDSDVYTRHHRHSKLSVGELHLAAIAAVLPVRLRNDIRQLRALGAPAGDEHLLSEFFKAEEAAISSEAHKRPTTLTQLFTRFEHPFRLANAYGLPECAQL